MGRPGSSRSRSRSRGPTEMTGSSQLSPRWCGGAGAGPAGHSLSHPPAAPRPAPLPNSSIFFVNPDFGRRQSAAAAAEIRPRSTFAAAADQSGEYLRYTVSTQCPVQYVQYTVSTVHWAQLHGHVTRRKMQCVTRHPTPRRHQPHFLSPPPPPHSPWFSVLFVCVCVRVCKKLRSGRSQVYEGPVQQV